MAKKNSKEIEAARQETIEASVSKTEQFYNENKKLIWSVFAAVVVLALCVVGYVKFIYEPKCAEAQE